MSKFSDEFERKNRQLISEHGPWTAHDIYLGENIYTRHQRNNAFPYRLKKIIQASLDLCNKEKSDTRILDLGCLEGGICVEFARQGCSVVGIEGRPSNIKKAELVKEMLNLGNLELVVDNVLNITPEKYGTFDIILCLGLLYHIAASDLVDFVKKMFVMSKRMVLIDTQVAEHGEGSEIIRANGSAYFGKSMREHGSVITDEEKLGRSWTSLTNDSSFWLTRPSLINLLADSGFTSVHEIQHPFFVSYNNRLMLAAIKGENRTIHYPDEVIRKVEAARQPEKVNVSKGIWVRKGLNVINSVRRLNRYLTRKLTGR